MYECNVTTCHGSNKAKIPKKYHPASVGINQCDCTMLLLNHLQTIVINLMFGKKLHLQVVKVTFNFYLEIAAITILLRVKTNLTTPADKILCPKTIVEQNG